MSTPYRHVDIKYDSNHFTFTSKIGFVNVLNTVLNELLDGIHNNIICDRDDVQKFLKLKQKQHGFQFSNRQLLALYKSIQIDPIKQDQRVIDLIKSKPFRGQSGVMVIAVFTSPYPNGQPFSCKWDCDYCPNMEGQPRSYLPTEPGVRRANANEFDPIRQFNDRANQYVSQGQTLDKIELLILGGTWASYPESYQETFIRDIFYASNTFNDSTKREAYDVETEINLNELADVRIIGVTIETRPDCITKSELIKFRKFAVTRVQIGIQHIDDRILDRVNRRCSSSRTIKAIRDLKRCGFKLDGHFMPDLPKPFKLDYIQKKRESGDYTIDDIDQDFSVVDADKKMFDTLVSDPDWQLDQWKIYPCEVTEHTKILSDYKKGIYVPYGHQTHRKDKTPLFDLIYDVMSKVPWHVRINRVIRDIPNSDIIAGNMDVNMRQGLDDMAMKMEMKIKNKVAWVSKIQSEQEIEKDIAERRIPDPIFKDIRSREIKGNKINDDDVILVQRQYCGSGDTEIFLSFETSDKKHILGFLRLRLNKRHDDEEIIFPELENCALIRELHVYGTVQNHQSNITNIPNISNIAQHKGYGTKLLNKAFELAIEHGYTKISVISGAGVKQYYRRFGFADEGYFMTKTLEIPKDVKFLPTKFILFLMSFLLIISILYENDMLM